MDTIQFQRKVEEKFDKLTLLIERITADKLAVATRNPITLYEGICKFLAYKLKTIAPKHQRDVVSHLKWLLKCCDVKVKFEDLLKYNSNIKSCDLIKFENKSFMFNLYKTYFKLQNGEDPSYSICHKRKLYLNNFLNYMIRCEYLTKNIVQEDKFLPKSKQIINNFLDYEFKEIIDIINYIYNKYPKFGIFFAILLFTGMRIEEAKGLQYGDFKNDHIILSRAVSVSNIRYTGQPVSYEVRGLKHRTIGNTRNISIVKQLTSYLNLLQWDKKSKTDFLFEPVIRYDRIWSMVLRELGYDPHLLKPSTLRKIFITYALDSFSVTEVAEMVGNTPAVIYRYYAMLRKRLLMKQKEKLESLLI